MIRLMRFLFSDNDTVRSDLVKLRNIRKENERKLAFLEAHARVLEASLDEQERREGRRRSGD